jgi:hypothetical protein
MKSGEHSTTRTSLHSRMSLPGPSRAFLRSLEGVSSACVADKLTIPFQLNKSISINPEGSLRQRIGDDFSTHAEKLETNSSQISKHFDELNTDYLHIIAAPLQGEWLLIFVITTGFNLAKENRCWMKTPI